MKRITVTFTEDEYYNVLALARLRKEHGGMAIVVVFSKEEYEKLEKLAKFRTKDDRNRKQWTVSDCLRAFAQACGMPEGKHWSKPATVSV